MSAARALLVVLASAACLPPPVLLSPPARSPETRTAIYVFAAEGRDPLVYVSDLGASTPALPEITRVRGTKLEVFALHYGCAIDVLGLVPGVARLAPEGEGQPLPGSSSAFASSFDDAGQSAWVEGPLPETVRAIRIERSVRCARFRLDRVTIAGTAGRGVYATFGVPSGDDSVLVAHSDGRFFRVTPRSVEPEDAIPASTPHLAYFRQDDGTLWFYGPGERLARGDLEHGFVDLPASPGELGRGLAWLSGSGAGEPFELFALTDQGGFARFDGAAWTELSASRPGRFDSTFGGVARIRAGEAVAVVTWEDDVLRYRDGAVTREPVEDMGSSRSPGLSAAARLSGATVIGSRSGRLFTDTGGTWSQLHDSPLATQGSRTQAMPVIAPLDDGALFGGGDGRFSEYQPGLGTETNYCNYEESPPVEGLIDGALLSNSFVFRVEALPCGYALLSKSGDFSAETEVTFLIRIP